MFLVRCLLALAALLATGPVAAAQAPPSPRWSWYEVDAERNVKVHLYLFWSQTCPHCPPAVEFARDLQRRQPWVKLVEYELSTNPGYWDLYREMAASLGRPVGPTPGLFYCKQMQVGYISYDQTGAKIERELVRWYDALLKHYRDKPAADLAGLVTLLTDPVEPPDLPFELPPPEETVYVPGWGEVPADQVSLPALTVVMAGCDAFNPCAFFVLLLLLSLLVRGQSRARMMVVGGMFVFASGFMYYLFMAAWLNLFFLVGHLRIITTAAGLLALVAAALNVKDFFWFKRGPSLSIPESAKPGLFQRMAGLINVSSVPSLLAGAAALAFASNLYELLCTSGFPMVYTRVLTLRELPPATYYLYLLLYNAIYVSPMAAIVGVFTWTLGSRKLTEREGRVLKLFSGIMMAVLGVTLVARPHTLNSPLGAIAVLGAAVAGTVLIVAADRWRRRRVANGTTPTHNL